MAAARLTLGPLMTDATEIAALRKLLAATFPDGEGAAQTVPVLWRALNKSRDHILRANGRALEDWTPDTVASVASHARALLDASRDPRVGFLAEPQARDVDAATLVETAEQRLHELCPEISAVTDQLSIIADVPVEQARVLAAWVHAGDRQELGARSAWDLLQKLNKREAYYRQFIEVSGLPKAAEMVAAAVSPPHYVPNRGTEHVLEVRIAADVVLRAGYNGPHSRGVLLAATVMHHKLLQRLEPLQQALVFLGESDTGVATLRAALLDHAWKITPPPTPSPRAAPSAPQRGVVGGPVVPPERPGGPAR